MAQVLYYDALAKARQSQLEPCQRSLERIQVEFPSMAKQESVCQAYQEVLARQGLWGSCRRACESSLIPGRESRFCRRAISLYCLACQKLVQEPTVEKGFDSPAPERVIVDLARLPNHPEIRPSERPWVSLAVAETLMSLKRYRVALQVLEDLSASATDQKTLALGHLMMACCCQEDIQGFKEHAEKALELDPEIPHSGQVHLALASFHASRVKECRNGEASQPFEYDSAANHLYAALELGETKIPRGSLFWLANYTYDKVKEHIDTYSPEVVKEGPLLELVKKGSRAFQLALGVSLSAPQGALSQSETVERDVLKLAQLSAASGDFPFVVTLLENFSKNSEEAQASGFYPSRRRFLLAEAYRATGQIELALEGYRALCDDKANSDPYVVSAACLRYATVSLQQLSASEIARDNRYFLSLLSMLEELQLRRSLAQEPFHLEAALELAKGKAALVPVEERSQEYLQRLLEMRHDFTSQDDLLSRDYHHCRSFMPEKDKVYQAYMRLLEGHIARMQSRMARDRGNLEEANAWRDKALAAYRSVVPEGVADSRYLEEQADRALECLLGGEEG